MRVYSGKACAVGAGGAEEVDPGPQAHDQEVVLLGVPVGEVHGPGVQVDAGDGGLGEGQVVLLVHELADGVADRLRVQHVGGHLVEQRLERVVVVAVHQHHVHRCLLELAGGADAPEPGAEDEDERAVGHGLSRYRRGLPDRRSLRPEGVAQSNVSGAPSGMGALCSS